MEEPREHPVQLGAKRVLASVVGLVLGLVLGLLLALFVVGFGDAFVVTVVLVGLAVAALAFFKPAPFLAVAAVLLSFVGVEGL